MPFLGTWILRLGLGLAAGFVVWKVYDVFASAFRERAQYAEQLVAANKAVGDLTTERDTARRSIETQAKVAAAELKARDDAARENQKRADDISRNLKNAQRKLATWEASAEPELARCLRVPLPRWLLDGADEAGHETIAPGLPAVLARHAGPDAVAAGAGTDR